MAVAFPGVKSLPPTITSDGGGATAALSMDEDTTDVTTVAAVQAHGGGPISYAVTAGADAALFDIIPSTGDLYFLTAPDFETPTDADVDGVYEVTVTATGRGSLTDTQAISVTVSLGGDGGGEPANALLLNGEPLTLNGQTLTLGA